MESQAGGGCIHRGIGEQRESRVHAPCHTSLPPTVVLCSYLVAQCILALLGSLGHLVVQVPQVTHLDLAGHMILLHLLYLDKYKVCAFPS